MLLTIRRAIMGTCTDRVCQGKFRYTIASERLTIMPFGWPSHLTQNSDNLISPCPFSGVLRAADYLTSVMTTRSEDYTVLVHCA